MTIRDGIAIIGMSCRYPGARDAAEFWRNLLGGVDSVVSFSEAELAASGVDPSLRRRPNYVAAGAILDGVEYFDADFFGMTAAEATLTDPQQRILLECAWEALEDSGYAPGTSKQIVGVYAGQRISEYLLFNQRPPDLAGLSEGSPIAGLQRLIGNDKDYLASRISYRLNLTGPSLTIQTACSTSLVAVHLACEGLLSGQCDLALAGGVSIRVPQKAGYLHTEGMIFSPDARTRAFDAGAGGTHFSSGAGIVVLKRAGEALADGDPIYAMIRGTAVNNDGSAGKAGYTAPSLDGEAGVIAQALAVAGVQADTVGYVEAHGSGTELGDAIEIAALTRVFRGCTTARNVCAIGSVKTNIGHTVQAAGVAGLIKTALMLKNRCLVPSLHFETPNPRLNLADSPFYVHTVRSPWSAGPEPRRAGVSSFGVGGTNAHAVLEEAPPRQDRPDIAAASRPAHLLCLSARDDAALGELARRYDECLARESDDSAADICFTANSGRVHFGRRLAAVGATAGDLREKLNAFARGEWAPGLFLSPSPPGKKPARIAFLFTGQGSRDWGEAVAIPERQPALFSLEYTLARLWQSWGIRPAFVLGHSIGAYAAACIAGVFTPEEGLRLVKERGRLMHELAPEGRMAAVFASEERVAAAVGHCGGEVSIATVNGPENVVISGDEAAVQQIIDRFQAEGVRSRSLHVTQPFHSRQIEKASEAFARFAAGVRYSAPRIPWISDMTGELMTEPPDAEYWHRHASRTVRFDAALRTLGNQGCDAFIEVGPDPVLLQIARTNLDSTSALWLASLRHGQSGGTEMLQSLADLYVHGADVDFAGFDAPFSSARRRVSLPTYPFQRRRYWLEPPSFAIRTSGDSESSPLLGRRLESPLREVQFESRVGPDQPAYLADHRLRGRTVFPAAAFVEMAASAAAQILGEGAVVVEGFEIRRALLLEDERPVTLQLVWTPETEHGAAVRIFSRSGEDPNSVWRLHATGKLAARSPNPAPDRSVPDARSICSECVPIHDFYARKRRRGVEHGPAFQAIREVRRCPEGGEADARLELPEQFLASAPRYVIHPALLDSCIQVCEAAEANYGNDDNVGLKVPFAFETIALGASHAVRGRCRAISRSKTENGANAYDVRLTDDAGAIVVDITGLQFAEVAQGSFERESLPAEWLRTVGWEPKGPTRAAGSPRTRSTSGWIIFTDAGGTGRALASAAAESSGPIALVSQGAAYAARPGFYSIDPSDPDQWDRLFREPHVPLSSADAGVVFLWGLDAETSMNTTTAALEAGQAAGCGGLLQLLRAAAGVRGAADVEMLPASRELILVTRGSQTTGYDDFGPVAAAQAPLWGFGRVLRNEQPEWKCRLVDLDPGCDPGEASTLFAELEAADGEGQVALRGGERYVARLAPFLNTHSGAGRAAEPFHVEITRPGSFDNLVCLRLERRAPDRGEVEIQVHSAGVNFRDVLNVLGRLTGPVGLECSGTVVRCGEDIRDLQPGDPVVAIATDSFASYVTVDRNFVAPVPDGLGFESAASLPLAFLTACYGLRHLARISSSDSVLIHAGAGGVGMAAIQVAHQAGARVFATASRRKQPFVRSLGVEAVMDSRTLDFAQGVLELTGGRGVDIVLNSLAGEFIPRSLSVLAPGGRFVELGANDTWSTERVAQSRPDARYFHFRLIAQVAQENPSFMRDLLFEVLEEIRRGALRPLPRRVFPMSEAAAALRTLAQARHVGKVVLAHGPHRAPATRRSPERISGEKLYLVTGGFGRLGLRVAEWLASKGARHLVLAGRSGPSSDALNVIRAIEREGVRVFIERADVADPDQTAALFASIRAREEPLAGAVHAAGILDDALLGNQTWERFEKVLRPKVAGAWNLHLATRHLPLDHFVLFSSSAGLLGGASQSSYAAANAFLDALAAYRRSLGLAATSIAWGPWAGGGMAGTLSRSVLQHREELGWGWIEPGQGLQVLSLAFEGDFGYVAVLPIDWAKYFRQFARSGMPSFLSRTAASRESVPAGLSTAPDLLSRLEAASPAEQLALAREHVRGEAAVVLGIGAVALAADLPFIQLGLDSLMALEIRNRIFFHWQIRIPMVDILEGSIEKLASTLLARYRDSSRRTPRTEVAAFPPAAADGTSEWEEGAV